MHRRGGRSGVDQEQLPFALVEPAIRNSSGGNDAVSGSDNKNTRQVEQEAADSGDQYDRDFSNEQTAQSSAPSVVAATFEQSYSLYTDYYAVNPIPSAVDAAADHAGGSSECEDYDDESDAQNYVTVPEQHSVPHHKPTTYTAAGKISRNEPSRDVLALLISGNVRGEHVNIPSVLQHCQMATEQAQMAAHDMTNSNMQSAVQNLQSASIHYRNAAQSVANIDIGLAKSFLLLSHSHSKRAHAIRCASRLPQTRETIQLTGAASTSSLQTVQNPATLMNDNGGPSTTSRTPAEKQLQKHKDHTSPTAQAAPSLVERPAINTKSTSLRAVVRDALHADNAAREEDISASVFLGNHDPSLTSTATSITVATATATDASANNPIDDMLQLEKELHTMNMELSIHASVANLAASTTKSTTANAINLSASLAQLRAPSPNNMPPPYRQALTPQKSAGYTYTTTSTSSGLESSWWGQSSFLHPPRSNNAAVVAVTGVDLASSISSWATATSHLWDPPNSALPSLQLLGAQKGKTPQQQVQQPSGPKSTAHSPQRPIISNPASPSRSASVDDAGNTHQMNVNANAKQLLRLLDSLKVLGDENAALLEQVEDANKARLEAKAAREEMTRFQVEYNKRFHVLKLALEKLRQQQMQQPNVSREDTANPVLTSEYLTRSSEDRDKVPPPTASSAKDGIGTLTAHQQQRILEAQLRSLTSQLQQLQQESKKKDATLKKYENFYKEVKARSAQRTAQREAEAAQQARTKQQPPKRPAT